MGCIECEVPAAVTRGRGGERTLEREESRDRERKQERNLEEC